MVKQICGGTYADNMARIEHENQSHGVPFVVKVSNRDEDTGYSH